MFRSGANKFDTKLSLVSIVSYIERLVEFYVNLFR
uniref:Uncharacterized protein n=1 Tax=Rhizophora mucronata TaxID=61149 RepID=A0A2P2Q983_RHIMU